MMQASVQQILQSLALHQNDGKETFQAIAVQKSTATILSKSPIIVAPSEEGAVTDR